MNNSYDLDLFLEELDDSPLDLGAEELADSNAFSTHCSLACFTSASCPGSTFSTVGSVSSGC